MAVAGHLTHAAAKVPMVRASAAHPTTARAEAASAAHPTHAAARAPRAGASAALRMTVRAEAASAAHPTIVLETEKRWP